MTYQKFYLLLHVTNVSWFEARAFAKYKDLKLPNVLTY